MCKPIPNTSYGSTDGNANCLKVASGPTREALKFTKRTSLQTSLVPLLSHTEISEMQCAHAVHAWALFETGNATIAAGKH